MTATFVVVSTDPGSFARQMLPRVADQLLAACRGPQKPLSHLQTLRHAQWLLERAEILMIEAARSEGASWAEIARARATSRQNERQAFERRQKLIGMDPLDRWIAATRERWARERKERTG